MNISSIQKSFGHRLIGTKFMKRMVVQAVLLLPEDLATFVTRHCWFVGSYEDGWAFTLRHGDLRKGECLIFLSDELMEADEFQIIWTITHEIGHVLLGHRNSIGKVQSKSEIRRQEKEADEFARKFLSR